MQSTHTDVVDLIKCELSVLVKSMFENFSDYLKMIYLVNYVPLIIIFVFSFGTSCFDCATKISQHVWISLIPTSSTNQLIKF